MPTKQAESAIILHDIDYSQNRVYDTLQRYIELRRDYYSQKADKDANVKHEDYLPFNNYEGICNGLTAYWLYLKSINEEGKFIAKLHHVVTWNAEKFKQFAAAASNARDVKDPIIEEFMSHVFGIQEWVEIEKAAKDHDINLSLNSIIGVNSIPKVTNPEFSISFVFNRETLADLIKSIMFEDKMVRFANGFHTVGGLYRNGVYYYYDSSNKHGLQQTANVNEFAKLVFAGLAVSCKSKEYMALNAIVFDLDGTTPAIYPDAMDYCQNLFNSSKKYKHAVLTHPNILRVGIRSDIGLLEWLFAEGFAPTAAGQTRKNVLNDTISGAPTCISMTQFLLDHNIDVNYRYKNDESAVGRAVRLKLTKMLYFLLSHGADPNIIEKNTETLLDYSIRHDWKDHETTVLLLAFGADPVGVFSRLFDTFTWHETYSKIIAQALELNKKLVELNHINSTRNALVQERLQAMLAPTPNPFAIEKNSPSLVKKITDTVKYITATPFTSRTAKEIVQILALIAGLEALRGEMRTIANLSKVYMAHKAEIAIRALKEYIKPYQSNKLIFSKIMPTDAKEVEDVFEKIVKPLLKINRS